MLIAVFADTHDRFPPDLPERLACADEIWHLGDVCRPGVLVEFAQTGKPLVVVQGNNDWESIWPLRLNLEREGVNFYLTHIPPRRAPASAQVVLHGHTHIPRDELDAGGVRWLNPGCITRPTGGVPPSFAWLEVKAGEIARWQIESV